MVQGCHLFLCLIFRMSRQFGEPTTGHLIFKQSSALPPEFQLYTSYKDPLIVLQSLTIQGVLSCSSMLRSSSSRDFKTYSSQISIIIVHRQEMKSYLVTLPSVKKLNKVCPTSIQHYYLHCGRGRSLSQQFITSTVVLVTSFWTNVYAWVKSVTSSQSS